MIYHLVETSVWELGRDHPSIVTPGADGFLHCCDEHQLAGVQARYFAKDTTLVALEVDPTRLGFETRYELGSGGEPERFPHVYGPIDASAVSRVIEI